MVEMAQKKQKRQKSVAQERVLSDENSTEVVQDWLQEQEPIQADQENNDNQDLDYLTLQDAARRFIVNYREHWFSSIRKHADGLGFGEGGTEDQCKSVLRHWGAKLV